MFEDFYGMNKISKVISEINYATEILFAFYQLAKLRITMS